MRAFITKLLIHHCISLSLSLSLYIYIYIHIYIVSVVHVSVSGIKVGFEYFFLKYWMLRLQNIIIIIMSCRQHGYPWLSLSTSPYCSSLLAGLQGYIPYLHTAAVCMFELVVLLLLGHMWGSIGVHHLWARLCFSSSVLYIWFV